MIRAQTFAPRPRVPLAVFAWGAAWLLATAHPLSPAFAGEHAYDVADPTYQAECGSCHVAYPTRLLSQSDWTALLSTLSAHFGSDASVDPVTLARLRRVLASGSGSRHANVATGTGSEPRITRTRWFVKEHREVADRFRPGRASSAASCESCHLRAADGDYSERTLRVPR